MPTENLKSLDALMISDLHYVGQADHVCPIEARHTDLGPGRCCRGQLGFSHARSRECPRTPQRLADREGRKEVCQRP